MSAADDAVEIGIRKETDSLGEVDVPSDKLWGHKRNGRLNISA
jgi:fumarate hydratase class II